MNVGVEHVAVIVVTFNSAPLLNDFICALGPGMGQVSWHLVVADNDSSDDSVAKAKALAPSATVIEVGRNAGYAGGINAAVRSAGSFSAVLALNPDVRLTPGCVPELLQALRHAGTGIAVPRLVDARAELIVSMRREPRVLRTFGEAIFGAQIAGRSAAFGETVTDPRLYETEMLTDWAEGSVQLISEDCWKSCGPWDESFFLYSEETEFDLRARDRGYATRYVPTAHAVHLEGGSASSPRLWPLLVINQIRLYRRRNGLVLTVPFWIATFLREGRRAIAGKVTGRAGVRALVSPSRFHEKAGPHSVR